ncbi:MAG: hypothetical protein ABI417_09395, partial [Coleofasciculaceae cyanobacterium]
DVKTDQVKTTFSEKIDFSSDFEKSIDQLTISADGQTFVTRSGRKTIKTWDIHTGSLKATLSNPKVSEIISMIFSPNGQTLLTNRWNETKIWNLKMGELRTILATGYSLGGLAISPDLQTSVSSSFGTLQIWDLKTGKYKTALVNPNDAERAYINSIAISPDGQTIVSSYSNLDNKPDSIKIWQMP